MSLQSIDIFGFKSGVQQKNKKPFLLAQDAFVNLFNAYVWREEVRKREGIQLIGRLRRVFDDESIGNSVAGTWSFNIYSSVTPAITPEVTAQIEPGSVRIYIQTSTASGAITGYTNATDAEFLAPLNGLSTGDRVSVSGVVIVPDSGTDSANGEWGGSGGYIEGLTNSFKVGVDSHTWGIYASGGTWSKLTGVLEFIDQGNGLLAVDPPDAANVGYINYLTGDVVLTHTGGIQASAIDFGYFPGLPVMGIFTQEIPGINNENTFWFDTKYCYAHDGSNFQEFSPLSAITWNGTDSDFFWATNYRGSDAQQRLFFVTNFVVSAGSPMRYTDGSTWNTFEPILGRTTQTQVLTSSLVAGSVAYGPSSLTKLPIVEGSVVITVSENDATEDDIVFRDTPKNGTLVSSGLNSGTINYTTGDINLSFNPALPGSGTWKVTAVYSQAGTLLISARILIPYYGRLLALNTWEGISVSDSVNIFNRCRFSQIGNPIQQDSWRSDTFGKGGFLDAPTNEEIVSATFYKNTLIVFFERSTWRLQYLGEYGLPFIWERISSDFGSDSTFSTVLFDSGVLAVGDKAIVGSSGGDVQRIDLDIPDQVYRFRNTNEGPKRVYGIRDFRKELVYWTYPDYDDFQLPTTQYFPNRTLVYNYRNNTYAFFRNTVTCFGNFKYPANITWDRLDVFWDNPNVFWDDGVQENMPLIASGNQQGFCHFYGYADVENGADSTIDALDQESLSVTDVTVGSLVTLEILNHNLSNDEVIYLTGLNYVVTASATAGSTTLNDQIYFVAVVDKDNINLFLWDFDSQQLYSNFTVTNVGTYVGGGVVALFPRMEIETKDFNPVKEQLGQNVKTSAVDFLFDASSPASINVKMKMNTTINAQGNFIAGNQNVETANSKTGYVQGATQASPCVITSKNHCLLDGAKVSFLDVVGMTELNGNQYDVTFLSTDTFSIGVDSSAYTTYVRGGFWEQVNQGYFTLSAAYAWHRFYATCYGQLFALLLTYNNDQMSQMSTHRQNFALNAMKLWYRPGGRNIFGK